MANSNNDWKQHDMVLATSKSVNILEHTYFHFPKNKKKREMCCVYPYAPSSVDSFIGLYFRLGVVYLHRYWPVVGSLHRRCPERTMNKIPKNK